jgi:two-component system sensor histidine kinase KdpD
LGLSICKSIVEAHGGRIWAENRSGGGELFIFILPLKEQPLVPLVIEKRGDDSVN